MQFVANRSHKYMHLHFPLVVEWVKKPLPHNNKSYSQLSLLLKVRYKFTVAHTRPWSQSLENAALLVGLPFSCQYKHSWLAVRNTLYNVHSTCATSNHCVASDIASSVWEHNYRKLVRKKKSWEQFLQKNRNMYSKLSVMKSHNVFNLQKIPFSL